MDFINLLKTTPKLQLIFLLLIFFIVAIFHLELAKAFYLILFCVGFTVASDLIFKALKKRSFQIPYSAVITGLILTLIIEPAASIFQILVICASAMLIKNFLRFGKHIFNPAASGLMVGWAVFGLFPSWWAPTLYKQSLKTPFESSLSNFVYSSGEFSIPNLLILLSVLSLAFVSGYKLKRYLSILTYLFSFAALSFIFSLSTTPGSLLNIFLSPGNLFFAFVMVAEPMTSPFYKSRQIMFGLTVALIQVIVVVGLQNNLIPFENFPDMSLLALLTANLLFFKFR